VTNASGAVQSGANNQSAAVENAMNTLELDVTVLDIQENMNRGKTRDWFHYAAAKYASPELGITHIGKMDTDAYLDVGILIPTLTGFAAGCPNAFGGRSWTCEKGAFCPPAGCGLPVGDDFLAYKSKDPGCWSYMQGGFYFMSSLMAHNVSEAGGWWHNQGKRCLPEDVMAGRAVASWGRTKERTRCMHVVNLLAQEVVWHPDWIGYWTPPFNKPE